MGLEFHFSTSNVYPIHMYTCLLIKPLVRIPPLISVELHCQRNTKANVPGDKQSIFHKKIFTWYEGETSTSELFNGRLHLIDHADYGKASANLTSIRESDQGWYHCQIIFPNRTPSARNNGTWYHLAVQGTTH
uniref:Immunoglobulin V-set domain-containing protein n=1 Tax=Glossina pallidipes TaxID=7398 RepID=A0A1A9ZJ18_GLOPL